MKLGNISGAGRSASAMPPRRASEEKVAWSTSTAMMSLYFVTDQ